MRENENHLRKFLTPTELAEKLSVKKSWIYGKSMQTGPDAIPRLKVGKYLRFNYEAVLDWLKKQNE